MKSKINPIKFDIQVLTFNRPLLLDYTLKSLSSQTYRNFVVHLIDHGSSPAVDPDKLPNDLDIRFTRYDNNFIDQHGNDVAEKVLEQLEGTHFINFADDDILLPNALELIVKELDKNPAMKIFSFGYLTYDHDQNTASMAPGSLERFNGSVSRFDAPKVAFAHISFWGIGHLANHPRPPMSHPSASVVSNELLIETKKKMGEIYLKTCGDVGFLSLNFNTEYVYYFNSPLAIIGRSTNQFMNHESPNNRFKWNAELQYLEHTPVTSCSFQNIVTDTHLKLLHTLGLDKTMDCSLRPDFFVNHIDYILTDDPWTKKTDEDIQETLPHFAESLKKYYDFSETEAKNATVLWLKKSLQEAKKKRKAGPRTTISGIQSLDKFSGILEYADCVMKVFYKRSPKPQLTNEKRRDIDVKNVGKMGFRDMCNNLYSSILLSGKYDLKASLNEMPNSSNSQLHQNKSYPKAENNSGGTEMNMTYDIPISLLVTVYNEEERIPYFLESGIKWANEIIVIDKSSTDRTKEICQQYGSKVKVIDRHYSDQGHGNIVNDAKIPTNDWVYFATASEIPTKKLIKRIKYILKESKGSLDLIYVPRKYYSFGIRDPRSPWYVSYFPFMINRKKAIISDTIHRHFVASDPKNTVKIKFSDDCCVYHLTHPSAKNYLRAMSGYFEIEAAGCENPSAKIRQCMANIARYEKQLQNGGNDILGHYFAWQIYWMGTALFVWEKWRGIDVPRYYQNIREKVLNHEWSASEEFQALSDKTDWPKDNCVLDTPLISAILWTSGTEHLIQGCLTDLESQTISDQIEVIIVDGGSRAGEESIVKEFQQKYSNIKYLKSDQQDSIYRAWNQGIKAACGKYITTVDVGDRLLGYAYERLAHVLETHMDVALVYADAWKTETGNQTFENFTPCGSYCRKDFYPSTLLNECYIGSQPMWRKNLHEKYGYFDENLMTVGDWEFWLRMAQSEKFLHLKEFLGLCLEPSEEIDHALQNLFNEEAGRLYQRYNTLKLNINPEEEGIRHAESTWHALKN